MPLASEKAKETGLSNLIEYPGVYYLRAVKVQPVKYIQSEKNKGRECYPICWEDVETGSSVWDNVLCIESMWPRLASLWMALGEADRNFDSVDELVESLLPILESGEATAYAECRMGKPSGGYPAKIEIGWWYLPEEGAAKLASGGRGSFGEATENLDDIEVPF